MEATLNTKESPYKIELFSPALTRYGGSDRMFLVLDVKPFTKLTLETSYKRLKLEAKNEKNSSGRQVSVEMWREGESNLKYDLDVEYKKVEDCNYI